MIVHKSGATKLTRRQENLLWREIYPTLDAVFGGVRRTTYVVRPDFQSHDLGSISQSRLGIKLKRRSATLSTSTLRRYTSLISPCLTVILGKVLAKERYPQLLLRRVPYSDSGESISKGEISTVVVAARACGNVKNLSLLTGYTVGGRRPEVMNIHA